MSMLNRFRNYLLEEEFTVNIYKNKVNVVNYISIDHFDSEKVIIRHADGFLNINGKNLIVSCMLKDEVLIIGDILKIELR